MIIKCEFCGSKFSHLKLNGKSCPNCGGSISDETFLKIQKDEEETKAIKNLANEIESERNRIDRELINQSKKVDVEAASKVMNYKHRLFSYKKVSTVIMIALWIAYLFFFSRENAKKLALGFGLIVGLVFTICSLVYRNKYYKKLLFCDGSTIGMAGDYFKTTSNTGEIKYIPTFIINHNGLKYESLGRNTSHRYISGDPVYIAYNPKFPEEMIPIKDKGPRATFKLCEVASMIIRIVSVYLAFYM